MKLVKTGLPLSAGEKLAEHMGMEAKDFFILYVGMPDSTFRRRFKFRHVYAAGYSGNSS